MKKEEIIKEVSERFDGLVLDKNWGEVGLFYNPEKRLSKGIYVLTFKEKDGPNDKASNINRDNVYRLNIGITKHTFIKLFGNIPVRPKAGKIIEMAYDFTELNKIMPHPVYGWMAWISILNPEQTNFEKILPLIEEGYSLAITKYAKRIKKLKTLKSI